MLDSMCQHLHEAKNISDMFIAEIGSAWAEVYNIRIGDGNGRWHMHRGIIKTVADSILSTCP